MVRRSKRLRDMEYLAFIPIPSHLTEVSPIDPTFHRASEVTFRLVRPETLRATAPGFNLRRFCRDIILNFNAYAAIPGTSDLEMEARAVGLLAKAKEDFDRFCPSSLQLFSAWAFRNARSIDSMKTGADVFLRLMTWVNPFPESPDYLDDLLDICDSLGCKYTIVMLAFGIYPGFRPFSERKSILERLAAVAQAVENVPPSYLARNKFLDRASHFAATLRTMQVASQDGDYRFPKVAFPSPAEVSVSLQWCMELLPFETAPVVYHVETPDEPDEDVSHEEPLHEEASDEEDEHEEGQQPGPSQPDFDMPALTDRRPPVRTRRAHRTRSNVASRGGSPVEGAGPSGSAPPPLATTSRGSSSASSSSSSLSSSSSSSLQKRPCGLGQEAPMAKRQNVGVQHAGSLQPFHAGRSAPRPPAQCMSSTQFMTHENTVHDQFIDFVTRFHDNLNTNGSDYLQYLVMQHGLLVEQVRLQAEPENQGQVALVEEPAGPGPDPSQGTQAPPPATTLAPSAMPATDSSPVQQPPEAQAHAPLHEPGSTPRPTQPPGAMGPEHGTSPPPGTSRHNGGQDTRQNSCEGEQAVCYLLRRYINSPKCPIHHTARTKQPDELPMRCSQQRSARGGNCLTPAQAAQVANYRARIYARLQEQVRMIPVNAPTQPATAGAALPSQASQQQQESGNGDYFSLQMQVPPLRPITFLEERVPPRASYTYAMPAGSSGAAAAAEYANMDDEAPPPYEPQAAHRHVAENIVSPTTRAGTFGLLAGQTYVNSGNSGTDDEGSSDGESSEESEGSDSDMRDSSDEDEDMDGEVKEESTGSGRVRRSLRLSTKGM